MKALSTLILLAFSFATFAQTRLEGKVTDAETDDPIIFATVALYQNGVLKTGTETDFDGYYSITELDLGEYEIEVTSTGYKPAKFEKAKIEKKAAYKFDLKLQAGIELITCPMLYYPPLISQDENTQGHIFRRDDIRHSPARN